MQAVWKKIGCASTVRSTDSAGHFDQVDGEDAPAAHMRSEWMSAEAGSSNKH